MRQDSFVFEMAQKKKKTIPLHVACNFGSFAALRTPPLSEV